MAYCNDCGTKLDDDSKFCHNCGGAVYEYKESETNTYREENIPKKDISENPEERFERKTVYDGEIHKCPNCGEVLKSFSANCPSCGYELRGAKATSSVQELANKLAEIEALEMPLFEEKKSVMKMLVGTDFKDDDELKAAQRKFDEQKANRKAGLIINFSVPNTKEDILEFMILASSNIDIKKAINDNVTQAWLSKLDQVYEKAKLLLGNHTDFAEIKYIYDKKKLGIKNRKFKGLAIASYIVGGYITLFNLLVLGVNIFGGIIGLLFGLGLIVLGTKFIMIYNQTT